MATPFTLSACDLKRVVVTSTRYKPQAAALVARTAVHEPLNGRHEIGGPQAVPMDDFVRDALAALGDPRPVQTAPTAEYFGTTLEGRELTPGTDAELSTVSYQEWAARR